MDWVSLENVKPYDGRYPLDLEASPFTIREWGWLKRLSGYLPATAADGYNDGDPELRLAIAVILLRRAGKIQTGDVEATYDTLADKPAGSIRLESDTVAEVDDELDPTESSSASSSSFGPDSDESSASSDASPKAIGTPASDISASPRALSAS